MGKTAYDERIEILGRSYKTKHVIKLLLLGPIGIWLFWAAFGVRGAMWVADWLELHDRDILQHLGQTGDLFGGVNALFAAYAFAGVAVAAYFQHKTFKVVEEQQRQQSFEPLFFKLLELSREHFRPTSLWSKDIRTAVTSMASAILGEVERGDLLTSSSGAIKQHVAKLYGDYYRDEEAILGPYFRTLFQTFKLIDRSGLPKNVRIQYANIARASLSRDEVILLMINCATSRGRDFKPLVEKYGLLKHLPVYPRTYRRFAKRIFKPTAVMDSREREKHWSEYPNSRPPDMPPLAIPAVQSD